MSHLPSTLLHLSSTLSHVPSTVPTPCHMRTRLKSRPIGLVLLAWVILCGGIPAQIEAGTETEIETGTGTATHATLAAPSTPVAVRFAEHVLPILETHCVKCHGAANREAELDLRTAAAIGQGGVTGPAIEPADPPGSRLLQRIESGEMPPTGEPPLSASQIATVRAWVLGGFEGVGGNPAETPTAAQAGWQQRLETGARFWSFQPPVRRELPESAGDPRGDIHPIDAWVGLRLQQQGLSPAPRAHRRTLIRRAYFDLLGLPPTPEQIEAFVNDPSTAAWPTLIDTLLALPQYGERWGRHWLDVARYADTGGYETDIYYKNAWRYRDYVVKSFNDDKPYDRFVQEQIAGDELWPDSLDLHGSYTLAPEQVAHFEALTGTGFYALGPQIHESNMDAGKLTLERLTDWVDTTGSAFLGLTLACARCHEHKFDPISQRDYYALQAVFASSKEVDVPIVPAMGVADFRQHYPRILAVDEARRALRHFEQANQGQSMSPAQSAERQRLLEAIAQAVLALPASDAQGVPFDGIMEIPTVTVLGHEREPLIRPVHRLTRGDLQRPRDRVTPALPEVLARQTHTEPALPGPINSRKELALWLTRPNHPLTARVIVNRIWQWHFGRGLVATPNDFGQMGTPPTHPELLDWLAIDFVERGWSIKALHRLIMTSETYQQASDVWSAAHQRVDADNTLLWRMNRRRLEGETLWDAIHAVAGTLNLKRGGRPVMPPLAAEELTDKAQWITSADPAEHTRRGLYIIVRRNFRFPLFETFDAPVHAVSCAARDVSTVAPQALWLMNHQTPLQQAAQFAARLEREAGADPAARVARAWYLATGRPATAAEHRDSLALVEQLNEGEAPHTGWTKFCLLQFNLSEFLFVD